MARPLGPVVDALLACACGALEDAERPACACYATIGPPVVGLCCECGDEGTTGELTINFEDLYPADAETLQRTNRVYPCRGGVRAADITLVLSRCFPTVDEAGQMPDPTAVQEAADELHRDADILWQAITCCAGISRLVWRGLSVDSDPEGGCSMIAARVTVEV